MPSFLEQFLTPLKQTYTKVKEVTQPLFIGIEEAYQTSPGRQLGQKLQEFISPSKEDIFQNAMQRQQRGVLQESSFQEASQEEHQKLGQYKIPETNTYLDPYGFVTGMENVGRKIIKKGVEKAVQNIPIFKGFKDYTTKFLDYAKGKSTFSKQEILDFARRPELKKGEADLLLRKLEEFEPKKPLLQGQKFYTISEDTSKIDAYIQKEFGGKIPDDELVDLGTAGDMISNEKVKKIFKDVLDVQITMTEKFEKPTIQAQIGKLPDDKLQIQIRRGLSEKQFNHSLTEELLHALRIRKGRTNYEEEQLLNYFERPTEKSAKAGVSKLLGEDFFGLPVQQRLYAQEFADSIRRDLLELKLVKVKEPQYSRTTIDETSASRSNRPGDPVYRYQGKNYEEVVFESPITTNGSFHYSNSKKYFAHARGDEVVESGKKIWREQEIQSDLLQKEGLERERLSAEMRAREIGGKESDIMSKTKAREAEISQLEPFTNDRFGERIMRERIKEKASKGYEKYRLPTGETIGKIEGFTQEGVWRIVENRGTEIVPLDRLTIENIRVNQQINFSTENQSWIITDILGNGRFKAVPKNVLSSEFGFKAKDLIPERINKWLELVKKEGLDVNRFKETFDFTGKSNPQYRRYENWGKFLKNKFGGKEITDSQGNSWTEIDLRPELKKLPIEAFSGVPFFFPKKKEKEQLFIEK